MAGFCHILLIFLLITLLPCFKNMHPEVSNTDFNWYVYFRRLWRARPVEMKGKEHELNVSSYEIWKRKYQLVLVEMKAKFTKNEESN